jgi:hypothetical protein
MGNSPADDGAGRARARNFTYQGPAVVGAGPTANRALPRDVLAAIAAMEPDGKTVYGDCCGRGRGKGDTELEAGMEVAEKGAGRAATDFWGHQRT